MAITREWTLMFYFASGNPLAPGVVSQLKALKNAGYYPEVNVVAHFDPEPQGTPAHVFDINLVEKLRDPAGQIGFPANDPFVRDLMFDRLWGDEVSRDEIPIRELIAERLAKQNITYNPPKPPAPIPMNSTHSQGDGRTKAAGMDGVGPQESLYSFLRFCATEYPAKHYMLFILGHGLVVGDDVFLYDAHASKHSVTLKELGKVLRDFTGAIGNAKFELVSFHSCSMSSLEVAYELRDTAKYMLASQGPAFVGSWPYSQILIRVFNDVKKKGADLDEKDVKGMLERIFYYVLYNSTDFVLAGYSFELSLCDLTKIGTLDAPLKDLAQALSRGLQDKNKMATNCILLAHLKSRSYWQENYTDLYDFCFCLGRFCDDFIEATGKEDPYKDIRASCDSVMEVLSRQSTARPYNPVVVAEFAGPGSQYSHGLSVFFPWTRPTSDRTIIQEYKNYRFKQTEWLLFLDQYWGPEGPGPLSGTVRAPYVDEGDPRASAPRSTDNLREDIISLMFNAEGALSTAGALQDLVKTHPNDPTGDECTCGSVKNYLQDTRPRSERGKSAKPPIPLNLTFFQS
jgi:hypothetical protein